jgi:oligopeptide/dipeptide ABC transporter ATP-binding protein
VPSSSHPLLDVQRLTTVFDVGGRPLPAVDDVSFEVRQGETLGLVGESGCGKSMIAFSILRLVHPPGRIAGGRVLFNGRNLLTLPERDMRKVRGAGISLIFQEPMTALNPVFTVGDQIAEAMIVHGFATKAEARRRAVELLEAVRVPEPARLAHDYPHQLSGGMRQRVLIATALACRPSLVIADEPTTALDVTIQAEILDLLAEMRAAFTLSMVLISHDLGVIAGSADRVAVMYAGRIVEQGPVRDVFRAPAHPYTKALLASIPGGTAGRRLNAIEGTVPPLAELPTGCAFAPRCREAMAECEQQRPARTLPGIDREVRCFKAPGQNPEARIQNPEDGRQNPSPSSLALTTDPAPPAASREPQA